MRFRLVICLLLLVCSLSSGQVFPGAVATDTDLHNARNSASTNLGTTIDNAATSIALVSGTGFASNMVITIGAERILCSSLVGNNYSGCARGYDNSTAAPHTAGVLVRGLATASDHNVLKDELKAVEAWLRDGKHLYCASATGTDSYACNMSPPITAYIPGARYFFLAGTANTGPATLALNGLSGIAIKKGHDQDLGNGPNGPDIEAGSLVEVGYDGTYMQMLSQLSNPPTGGGTTLPVTGNVFRGDNMGGALAVTGTSSDCTHVDGSSGPCGTVGSHWLTGSGVPGSGTGVDGDFYLRTNGDFYGPKTSGAWGSVVGNLVGPSGAAGTNGHTILTTSGMPSNATGTDGDYAYDPTAKIIYGPKASGTWPSGVSLGGGSGGSVFTGSTAANPGACGATRHFDLADVSLKSTTRFECLLSADLTESIDNPTAGAKFSIELTQAAGGYSVTGLGSCPVSKVSGSKTTQFFEIAADGTTVVPTLCTTTDLFDGGSETSAAPTPGVGEYACWPDSTDHDWECKFNNSAVVYKMFRSGVDVDPVLGQITITALNCTNQFVRNISARAAGTCAPIVTNDLPDTTVTPGTYGDTTHTLQVVVDAKGRITSITNITPAGGGGGSTTTGLDQQYRGITQNTVAGFGLSWGTDGTVTPANHTGSNVLWSSLDMSDSGTPTVNSSFVLPATLPTSITFTVGVSSSSTSQAVKTRLYTGCIASGGGSPDPTYGTAQALNFTTSGTANNETVQTVTTVTNPCSGGDIMVWKFDRDVTDTSTATIRFHWFRFIGNYAVTPTGMDIQVRGLCQNTVASVGASWGTAGNVLPNCQTGTNVLWASADFTDSGTPTLYGTFLLPGTLPSSITATVGVSSSGTTQAIKLRLATSCVTNNATPDSTWGTAQAINFNTSGTANNETIQTLSAVTNPCAGGDRMNWKLDRDVTDTSTLNVRIHWVRFVGN